MIAFQAYISAICRLKARVIFLFFLGILCISKAYAFPMPPAPTEYQYLSSGADIGPWRTPALAACAAWTDVFNSHHSAQVTVSPIGISSNDHCLYSYVYTSGSSGSDGDLAPATRAGQAICPVDSSAGGDGCVCALPQVENATHTGCEAPPQCPLGTTWIASANACVPLINSGTSTWQYGYDAMGRPTTVLDPNGLASYTYYDSLGRPIQTQQPANTGSSTPTTTGFAYNANDNLTQVTDPRNLATTYSPNGLGDVTAQTSPDTEASQYTYDLNGYVLTKTDARGKLTQYAYDNLNRLTSISYPTGTASVLEYDGGSTLVPGAIGQLTRITDASGQTVYSYDSLGRKTSKTQTIGGKTFIVGYSWGNAGSAMDKLTAITYPSGTKVNYSYDAQGAVNAVTVNPPNANGVGTNTGSTLPLIAGITTNAESKLTGWTWASTKTQAIAYDANGQISAYNLGDPTTTGIRRTILRDTAGRITGYTHTSNGTPVPALDQSFGYDNLNRLISATLGSSAIQYSYDATGNRTAKVIGGTSYPNTISTTSNRLNQTQDTTGTAIVVHDAAGNITGDGVNTYGYSDRGRLATVTNAGGTVSYSYSALELRMSKAGPTALVPTGAAYYVYDEEGKLLGEYDANGVPQYETIYMGSPVGVIKQTGTAVAGNIAVSLYNVWTDQIGAPRVITRQSDEAMVWRWDMAEPFGATAPDQNPSSLGAFSFNQRLPGQTFDAESGLFQNWNREYNPRIGRYMQSDPIGLAGGINTFAYVESDPLEVSDPMGLQTVIPAPVLAPIAGSIARPSIGTLVDPIVTPGMPDPKDPNNSQKCKKIKKTIENLKKEIYNKRYPDLQNNPQNLPQRIGPGEALSETVRGHEVLLNRQLRRLKDLEEQYDKDCLC
jgi:RHS repeat-associated protein